MQQLNKQETCKLVKIETHLHRGDLISNKFNNALMNYVQPRAQLKESYLNHRNTDAYDYYAHSKKKIRNVCTLDILQKPVLQSENKKTGWQNEKEICYYSK